MKEGFTPRGRQAVFGSRLAATALLAAGLVLSGAARADDSPPARKPSDHVEKGRKHSSHVEKRHKHSARVEKAHEHSQTQENVVASYYAQRHEGRPTTSGEKYRAEKLTAAHAELPFGTLVRVIRTDTGKDVVVRVNDRCGRKKTPFIDLSRAAARELGILRKGTTKVQLVLLGPDQVDASVAKIDTP